MRASQDISRTCLWRPASSTRQCEPGWSPGKRWKRKSSAQRARITLDRTHSHHGRSYHRGQDGAALQWATHRSFEERGRSVRTFKSSCFVNIFEIFFHRSCLYICVYSTSVQPDWTTVSEIGQNWLQSLSLRWKVLKYMLLDTGLL